MKRTFDCGQSGKGKYCHACAALAESRERELRKTQASESDQIDLSCVTHLPAVQREARGLLQSVRDGAHPYALKGKPIKSSRGHLVSVPVGRSYRLMFDAVSLSPLQLLSHEIYNNAIEASRP